MKKKYLVYLGLFFVLCLVGSYVGQFIIESNTPPFILAKLNQLKASKSLMDSIGGFGHFEYSYNKNAFKLQDTVRYSIKITGNSNPH